MAGDDELLVRVRASSIHADVWHVMRGVPYVLRIMGAGVRGPKNLVPGTDLAGVVESVGANVTRFQPGDEVFGQSLVANLWRHGGAFAEYAAVPEARFEPKPAGLTFEQAAAVPTSGSLAVQVVRDEGRIGAGQNVLINGAGGAVGTFAVQLAKAYGAHVTGVDAADKLDMIRSIGADRVLDYAKRTSPGAASATTRSSTSPATAGGPTSEVRSPPRGPSSWSGTISTEDPAIGGSGAWVASRG